MGTWISLGIRSAVTEDAIGTQVTREPFTATETVNLSAISCPSDQQTIKLIQEPVSEAARETILISKF